MKASGRINEFLKQHPVDLIHCSDVLALLLIAFPAMRARIPVLYNVIFYYEWPRRIVFNILALFLVKKIATNSRAVSEDVKRKTFFLSHKIGTIYMGVDAELFRPMRNGEVNLLRHELGLDPEMKLVGMVGRYDPSKGHKIFLQAASIISRSRRDVKFIVIGGLLFADVFPLFESYRQEVMEFCHRAGLGGDVVFLPHREDMPEVIRSLDVFVLPSINEGFGLVVLEAIASGVPVVASRGVGALEPVGDLESVFPAETETQNRLPARSGTPLNLFGISRIIQ